MSLDASLDLEDFPTLESLDALEHLALANVYNFGPDPAAFASRTITTDAHAVAQIAIAHSRGAWRLGVIAKVGQRNVEFLYTTEGSIREAMSTQALYQERLAQQSWLQVAEQAGLDHDFYVREADPITRVYPISQASSLALYTSTAAIPRAHYVQNLVNDEELRIRMEAKKPWTSYLNFTRKPVPLDQAFVLADQPKS